MSFAQLIQRALFGVVIFKFINLFKNVNLNYKFNICNINVRLAYACMQCIINILYYVLMFFN